MTTFLTQPRPFGIVHRGFGAGAEDNSPSAVQKAVDLGFTCVEIDIRLTADGHLVVWHDPTLPAADGSRPEIASMTLAEVVSTELPGRSGVAQLTEFLTRWPNLTFILDVKREECVEPLARMLKELGAVERVCIHGTDTDGPREEWVVSDDRSKRMRELLGPQLCTVISATSLLELARTGELAPGETGVFVYGTGAYESLKPLWPAYIQAAHAQGLVVSTEVPHDDKRFRELLDLGVEAFNIDDPMGYRSRMIAMGLWHDSSRASEEELSHEA